jgi:hypothetical protein
VPRRVGEAVEPAPPERVCESGSRRAGPRGGAAWGNAGGWDPRRARPDKRNLLVLPTTRTRTREPASEKRQKENNEEAAGRFQRTPRNIINGGQRLNKNLQLVRNRKMEYSHGRTIGFGFQV